MQKIGPMIDSILTRKRALNQAYITYIQGLREMALRPLHDEAYLDWIDFVDEDKDEKDEPGLGFGYR